MHYTLHLTDGCNLACRYCYVHQDTNVMSTEVAHAAAELAARSGENCGLIFFGGEPLLYKDRILDTVQYAESLRANGAGPFHYKVTTNGTLLDDAFLESSRRYEIFVALSFDGVRAAHDRNRVTKDGRGTFDAVEDAARRLLRARPYAPVMMTVAPNTVEFYAESVDFLYGLGFRYLLCTLDYSGEWTQSELRELARQYRLLADWYRAHTLAEDKFYLSPFEVKLSSWIHRGSYCHERCELGRKQISVAPDGRLYPCVQFVGMEEFCIGDVFSGVDEQARTRLYLQNAQEREPCSVCAIRERCNHTCACLNKQSTGDFRAVSPILCAHERILLPIADRLAEELYQKRSAMFLQKQYNDMFPMLSLLEDQAAERKGGRP